MKRKNASKNNLMNLNVGDKSCTSCANFSLRKRSLEEK